MTTDSNTTVTSSSNDLMDDIEDFIYTPYGVALVAILAVLLTSLLWTFCCCVYCCYRKRQQINQSGTAEANRDLYYLGVGEQNGTLTSGYNTAPRAYSMSTLGDNGVMHTSLDSIINEGT